MTHTGEIMYYHALAVFKTFPEDAAATYTEMIQRRHGLRQWTADAQLFPAPRDYWDDQFPTQWADHSADPLFVYCATDQAPTVTLSVVADYAHWSNYTLGGRIELELTPDASGTEPVSLIHSDARARGLVWITSVAAQGLAARLGDWVPAVLGELVASYVY